VGSKIAARETVSSKTSCCGRAGEHAALQSSRSTSTSSTSAPSLKEVFDDLLVLFVISVNAPENLHCRRDQVYAAQHIVFVTPKRPLALTFTGSLFRICTDFRVNLQEQGHEFIKSLVHIVTALLFAVSLALRATHRGNFLFAREVFAALLDILIAALLRG
jgi:hypothetical protein